MDTSETSDFATPTTITPTIIFPREASPSMNDDRSGLRRRGRRPSVAAYPQRVDSNDSSELSPAAALIREAPKIEEEKKTKTKKKHKEEDEDEGLPRESPAVDGRPEGEAAESHKEEDVTIAAPTETQQNRSKTVHSRQRSRDAVDTGLSTHTDAAVDADPSLTAAWGAAGSISVKTITAASASDASAAPSEPTVVRERHSPSIAGEAKETTVQSVSKNDDSPTDAQDVSDVAVSTAASSKQTPSSPSSSFFFLAPAAASPRRGPSPSPAVADMTSPQKTFSSSSAIADVASSGVLPSPSPASTKSGASSFSVPSSTSLPSAPSASHVPTGGTPPGVTRLFLQVTPLIKDFLLRSSNAEAQKAAATGASVDLDCLMHWVDEYNKSCGEQKKRVKMSELVEGTYIVGKEATAVDLSKYSASDRLRMRSEERKFQNTLRSIFGTRSEDDNFASYTQSVALGVNALLGVFLMFLAGYWVSEYSGVTNFTVKVTVGIICSFGCLVIEVLLLLLHDEVQQRKKKRRAPQQRLYHNSAPPQ